MRDNMTMSRQVTYTADATERIINALLKHKDGLDNTELCREADTNRQTLSRVMQKDAGKIFQSKREGNRTIYSIRPKVRRTVIEDFRQQHIGFIQYLASYGWVIPIMVVVIASLYSIGVFSIGPGRPIDIWLLVVYMFVMSMLLLIALLMFKRGGGKHEDKTIKQKQHSSQ